MTKRRFMQILLTAACLLILVGAVLGVWVTSTDGERNVIDVRLRRGETETLRFEELSLIPGGSSEYVVALSRGGANSYRLNIAFKEIGSNNKLGSFARMRVEVNGEEICDQLLGTLIKSEGLSLPVDFAKSSEVELRFVCYLPLEIGNEAQNATADFEILLSASNE